jgi:hypothetical protein
MRKLILATVLVAFATPVLAAEPDPIGDVVKAVEGIVMIPVNVVDEMMK